MIDISNLFVDSYFVDLGDTIDDIEHLFDEDDPSLVVVRESSDPLLHSLHNNSLEIDVIVDTYGQHLEEVSLSLDETPESLDLVLHSSSLDIGLSFLAMWPSTPDLKGATFSIDLGTLE